MSIAALKVVNQRLKPIDRKIRQILRIGIVAKAKDSLIDVEFSSRERVTDVPFLSMNGLQRGPVSGDNVLVFSPEGQLSHSVAIAVVAMADKQDGKNVRLTSGEQTLGQVLKNL